MSPLLKGVTPENSEELHRISAENQLRVLNSQYESLFNSICKFATIICNVPIAMITFVDEQTVWIKIESGADGISQVPCTDAFCGWVVKNDAYLEIPDISLDPNHFSHPLVAAQPNFRFYAGAPLKLPLGEVIGTLCIFDTKPNALDETQKLVLIALAEVLNKALVFKNHIKH
ncbi:MAG TPA: GAF domain-containing protein [Methylotenera sp.]|nr:GAF domain-containing protein [Methylotenera sp.]